MKTHDAKRRTNRTIPPPPGPEDGDEALVAYLHKYPAEELEKAGYLQEPTPEEIRDLEESAEREMQRQKVKGLAKEYPKAHRELKPQLVALLSEFPNLKPGIRKETANRINVIADKARDLEEIVQRLLNEKHNPEESAELLYAFQHVAGYIRSYSEKLGNPIVEVFDRAKGFDTGSNHTHTDGLFSRANAKAKGSKKRVKQ
jgi:hypothetical protein